MKIAGYLPTSLIEWPGKVVAVIFTPGCNFRCPFCHNKKLVVVKKSLPLIPERKILADIKKRKQWLDGVVITGGEPTLQKDLVGFCEKIKDFGLGVMIETNGSFPEVVKRLLQEKLVDFWAMDFKTCWRDYPRAIGWSKKFVAGQLFLVKNVKKSFETVLKSGLPFVLRTTIVPSIHDQQVLLKMTEQIGELVEKTSKNRDFSTPGETKGHSPESKKERRRDFSWQWQDFRSAITLDPSFQKITPYSSEEISAFFRKVRKLASFEVEYKS